MGTGGSRKAKAPLVASLRVRLDPNSIAQLKQDLQRALADVAKNIGQGQGVSSEQARTLVNLERVRRATAEREAAENRLAQTVVRGEQAKQQAIGRTAATQSAATDKAVREAEAARARLGRNALQAATGAGRTAAQGALGLLTGGTIESAIGGLGGPLATAGTVAIRAAQEIQRAYASGQEFLRQVSLTQREIGLSAQQASVSRSFSAFTQDPDSPFAAITPAQVQAQLQLLKDVDAGLAEITPQAIAFRDALNQIGISYLDQSGQVKEVTQFTLEFAQALEGLSAGQRARLGQQVGGLFGKDFLAVASAGREQLERLAVFSVQVNQQQIDLANDRAAAIQISTNAEREFQLALTQTLAPLDIQVNNLKAVAALDIASVLGGDRLPFQQARTFRGERNQQLQNVLLGRQEFGTGLAQNFSARELLEQERLFNQQRVSEAQGFIGRAGGGIASLGAQENLRIYSAALADTNRRIKELDDSTRETARTTADAAVRTRQYKDNLKELDAAAKTGIEAEKERIEINKDVAKSFSDTINSISEAGRVYDDFYKNLAEARGEQAQLRGLAGQQVAVTTVNGQVVNKDQAEVAKDVADLLGDINVFRASEADELARLNDLQGDYNDKLTLEQQQAQRAQQQADLRLQKQQALIAKGKTPANILAPGSTMSLADVERLNTLQDKIALGQAGGTSLADIARDQQRLADLNARAQAYGVSDISQFTGANIGQIFQARGLSESEAGQLQRAVEREQELLREDQQRQFDLMKEGISGVLEQQANLSAGTKSASDAQKEMNDALDLGTEALNTYAESVGLFQSAGFSRAILEQALQAQFLKDALVDLPSAFANYQNRFNTVFGSLNRPEVQAALSGQGALSVEQQQQAGLIQGAGVLPSFRAGGGGVVEPVAIQGAQVVERIAQVAGLSIEAGVKGALKNTTEGAKTEATNAAKAYDDAVKEVLKNPYLIKTTADPVSLEQTRQQIAQYLQNAANPNFVPPPLPAATPEQAARLGPGQSPFRGGRQHGGSVWPGGSFMVGEAGPEMFMPQRAGSIIDANTMYRLGMGSQRPQLITTTTTNNTYNTPISVTLEGDKRAPAVAQGYGPNVREAQFVTDGMELTVRAQKHNRYI